MLRHSLATHTHAACCNTTHIFISVGYEAGKHIWVQFLCLHQQGCDNKQQQCKGCHPEKVKQARQHSRSVVITRLTDARYSGGIGRHERLWSTYSCEIWPVNLWPVNLTSPPHHHFRRAASACQRSRQPRHTHRCYTQARSW